MNRITDALLNAWDEFVGILPNFLFFLLILIVGLIISKILERVVHAVLSRLKVNRLFERTARQVAPAVPTSQNGARAPAMSIDIAGILSRIVYWLGVLYTLFFAFGAFGDNPFSDLLEDVINFIPKAIVAVILVVIAAGIANAVRGLVGDSLRGRSYGPTVANVVGLFILVIGVIAALAQVGIALAVVLPLLYFFLLTLTIGVGGSLIGALRPYMEEIVASLRAEFNTPPAEEMPPVVEEPPVEEPPVEEVPPAEEVPPVEEPPVETPPEVEPPVEEVPPVETPPVETPPEPTQLPVFPEGTPPEAVQLPAETPPAPTQLPAETPPTPTQLPAPAPGEETPPAMR